VVHQLRREPEAALDQAQRNATFAGELGFPFWEGAALVVVGTERARMGDRAGLADIGRGIALLSDAGSRSGTSNGLATLAEAHFAAGDTQAALGTVEAALSLSAELGEPYWDAELMRLKAVFLLADNADAGALADELLRTSLAEATNRGAASLALRTAITLQDPQALASALSSMEGGEDTADVREARQLIETLSTDALEAKEVR
jgi:hypothetical protein